MINLTNNGKEAIMEQLKKVKIAFKLGFNSILETFWAIGASVVAGDVLLRSKTPAGAPRWRQFAIGASFGTSDKCRRRVEE